MREYLKSIKRRIGEVTDEGARRLLDKYINLGIVFEDVLSQATEGEDIQNVLADDEEDDDELDLEPLKEFMSDYIGMLVIGVKGFYKDTTLEQAEDIQCKIVSDCKVESGSIVFQLSGVTGATTGYLKLSPSKHGSFAEREPSDIPMYSSRYRIFFYGGDTLEYLDGEKLGSIEYQEA
jgi:hypothetical protein